MLTEKSRKTIDACRFCCMCRHLCPLGLSLGKELNNPRAKALLLSLVEKKALDMKEIAPDIFECCLCNACAENCETGYEPAVFIREVRSGLIADGLAPENVMCAVDQILKDGSFYGPDAWDGLNDLEDGAAPAKVLVYIGALACTKAPASAHALVSLLKKADVHFTVLRGKHSSGAAEYDLIGEVSETREICQACATAINDSGCTEVVVLNPTDARMMKQEYPAWGIKLNAEVITATSYIDRLVAQGRLTPRKAQGVATFHDPSRLARDLQETEPARRLMTAMGYELKEMWQSRALTRSSGGEVLASYAPALVAHTAAGRMENAVGTGADMLVCAAPDSEINLSSVPGLPVYDLFVLLDELC